MVTLLKPSTAGCVARALLALSGAMLAPMTLAEPSTSQTQPAVANDDMFVKVNDTFSIRLIGVSSFPAANDSWRAANGAPLPAPPDERIARGKVNVSPDQKHLVAWRIEKPKDVDFVASIAGMNVFAHALVEDDGRSDVIFVSGFGLADTEAKTAKLEIGVLENEWTTIAVNDNPEAEAFIPTPDGGTVTFHPVESLNGRSSAYIEYADSKALTDQPAQVVGILADGSQVPSNLFKGSDGANGTMTGVLHAPADKVEKVLLQTRGFSVRIDVSDVSLAKGHITDPKLTVREK